MQEPTFHQGGSLSFLVVNLLKHPTADEHFAFVESTDLPRRQSADGFLESEFDAAVIEKLWFDRNGLGPISRLRRQVRNLS